MVAARRYAPDMRPLAILVSLVLLAGCVAPGPPPQARPGDFAMHVVVHPPDASRDEPLPRWVRPASYVVEPDGRLRALFGPGAVHGRFPPIARQLEPGEIRRLYDMVLTSDLLDLDAPGRVSSVRTYEPAEGHAGTAVFDLAAANQRRVVAREIGGEPGPVRDIVDRLAEMTWQPSDVRAP